MTQFELDQKNKIATNNGYITKGNWNLILSRRDVSLFCKGIKPHARWRLKDVKAYFGIKGGKESVLQQLNEMVEKYRPQST